MKRGLTQERLVFDFVLRGVLVALNQPRAFKCVVSSAVLA